MEERIADFIVLNNLGNYSYYFSYFKDKICKKCKGTGYIIPFKDYEIKKVSEITEEFYILYSDKMIWMNESNLVIISTLQFIIISLTNYTIKYFHNRFPLHYYKVRDNKLYAYKYYPFEVDIIDLQNEGFYRGTGGGKLLKGLKCANGIRFGNWKLMVLITPI